MLSRCILIISVFIALSGDSLAGGRESSRGVLMDQLFAQLRELENEISDRPEDVIIELDSLIKVGLNKNLYQPVAYGYLLMGRSYKQLNQPELAFHFLDLANANYLKSEGKISASKKKFSSKSESYKAPNDKPPLYYLTRGEIYAQLEQYTSSNKDLIRYKGQIKEESKRIEADYLIAQNYYALKEYDSAIEQYQLLLAYEQKVGNDERMKLCYSRLAASYISKGETEKGLEYYNKSIQKEVSQEAAEDYESISENKEIVSKALRKQNKLEEELDVRNQALDLTGDGKEYLKLAQVYFQSENYDEAEAALDDYFNSNTFDLIDKEEIEVIKKMAKILKDQSQDSKALAYLLNYDQLKDTIESRIMLLEKRSKELGRSGYQNAMELEVLQKDREMSEITISHLMRESDLKEELVSFQKIIIYLLCAVIFLGIIGLLYISRVSKQRRKANQRLALRSLRSQMNPHFIFNALNSVNSFISLNDEKSANRFLSEFSTLMRTVMENSEHDFITLAKELEIIEIYASLEHFRFKDKFEYRIEVSDDLDTEFFELPPMLVQPYIENAIWHGLRYKETQGELIISFEEHKGNLIIKVQDNGIGRKKSQELKTKNQKRNKSMALRNIDERVQLFNSLHKIKVDVSVKDLNEDGTGTSVELIIPQRNHG